MIVSLTKIYRPSDFNRKERQLSIRMSHSIIMHKTTAMIVSLTKYIVLLILSRKECPLSYQNNTEYNGKTNQSHTSYSIIINKYTAMIVSLTKIYLPSDLN